MRALPLVLGCLAACGGKLDPGPATVTLSSLDDSCDGLTARAVVAAMLPRYEGVYAPSGHEPSSWSCSTSADAGAPTDTGVPYTMTLTYDDGPITCHHTVDFDGANGAHYHQSGSLEVGMRVTFSTTDGTLAESFQGQIERGTSFGWPSSGLGPCAGEGSSPYRLSGSVPKTEILGSVRSLVSQPFMAFTATVGTAADGLTPSGAGHASGEVGARGTPDGVSVQDLGSFEPR